MSDHQAGWLDCLGQLPGQGADQTREHLLHGIQKAGGVAAGSTADTGAQPGGEQAAVTRFYAQFELDPVRAIRQLEDVLRNIVDHLAAAEGSALELTFEVNATSKGFDDRTRRVVNENATQLGAKGQEFE